MLEELPEGKSKAASGDTEAEFHHGGIFPVALDAIRPALINDAVYSVIDPNDASIVALASELADPNIGQLEPIVITTDDVILSGHRRYAACKRAGLSSIRARRFPIASADPRFTEFLVRFNNQREKRADEIRQRMRQFMATNFADLGAADDDEEGGAA